MPLFYAYIANIGDEETFRWQAVFANRAVADEWWRAMSASAHARFIKRVAPGVYAQDATQRSLSGFFDIPELKPIAEMFRGRVQFTNLNDGTAPTLPPREVTDHISGGWYHIRSISNHALCWHYDAAENRIRASGDEPTPFRISIRNGVPEETIMASKDRITLYISSHLHVDIGQSGQLQARAGSPVDFKFHQLESGDFAMFEDASVVFVDAADSTLRLMSWELFPAPSPTQHETTIEPSDAENLDVIESSSTALDAWVKSLMREVVDARQESRAAATAADRELANLKQQLDVMESTLYIMGSSNEALVEESAAAKQNWQVATAAGERCQKDLAKSKLELQSSQASLVQERADARQKLQTAAAAAEIELADVQRQLDAMESSNQALVEKSADAKQRWKVATAAAERCHKDLAKSKLELRSSKAALVQERADARQKLQIEITNMQRQLDAMESSNEALVEESADAKQELHVATAAAERCQKDLAKSKLELQSSKAAHMQERADARQRLQTAAAAAETELSNVQRQLNAMESSNEALVEESAHAKQELHVATAAAERCQKDLAKSKLELQSSKVALMQERADARQKSHTVAATAEMELAGVKRQLDIMESSNEAPVQESADAKQTSQTAAAAAETELADVKRQLDVMESSNAALDAGSKSLMQEVADAREKWQALEGAPVKWLADFLPNGRQVSFHSLYRAALLSLSEWKAGEATDTYLRILGIIIICQAPLTDVAITDLLRLDRDSVSACRTALRPLGCFIEWSEGQSARILHQSFSDYLTDQSVCSSEPWFIDVLEHHHALTLACLRIMNEGLHFNMGDLKSSYIGNADVPDLSAHVEAVIPQSLSYSCQFWGHHLRQMITGEITGEPSIQGLILQFFEFKFLYWLEVLSLSGEMRLASRVLVSVMEHVADPSNKVYAFAQVRLKFVEVFAPTLARSTPHIYLSCMHFAPRVSVIKQRCTRALKNILIVESGMDDNWPAFRQVFEGHTDCVMSVAFSPDGQRLASGSQDGAIRIWDAQTGTLVAGPFKGHTGWVLSVVFSPDGQHIASGSADNTLRIWDAQTGTLVAGPFKGRTGWVFSVVFSPDGQHIASGSGDNTIQICDVKTGALVAGPFIGHTGCVFSVSFSPDGQRIASGSGDKCIRIYDVKTGTLVAGPFEGHTGSVFSVSFSPDGQRIVSGSGDKTVRIYDAKTGTLVAGSFTGHTGNVFSVAFSPDGQRIVSGSRDKTVQICNAQTGTLVAGPFKGHTDVISSVTFSPDGQRIASGSYDKCIRICDAKTGTLVAGPFEEHTKEVRSVVFPPDGQRIASGSRDSTM
ncbi:hypothetical protein FIBSPDRAFT_1042895 [Athelia psychrophila]|uniref:Uncharacterized protein n=1 Tax=Athelia psychrophila TaxID=1759441 RepID=A0A166LY54_9AGAM|nr:hypothetical protein FIBSPDRAFT_1042895 [Fibularhizoctonia sp. CBS 109695]